MCSSTSIALTLHPAMLEPSALPGFWRPRSVVGAGLACYLSKFESPRPRGIFPRMLVVFEGDAEMRAYGLKKMFLAGSQSFYGGAEINQEP